ncbi:formate--tetrahydrofolate ligase, partial [Staphylococcus warneri]|uniref:formate--tetrahydrofolate ligase n=1 Tax=Staphylococcus warneri TaxID=1292 RepID=UPI0011A22B9F
TVASQIMPILCLTRTIKHLTQKITKITIRYTPHPNPLTLPHLKLQPALPIILKHPINPNLLQSIQPTPPLLHPPPFPNIPHPSNSILPT